MNLLGKKCTLQKCIFRLYKRAKVYFWTIWSPTRKFFDFWVCPWVGHRILAWHFKAKQSKAKKNIKRLLKKAMANGKLQWKVAVVGDITSLLVVQSLWVDVVDLKLLSKIIIYMNLNWWMRRTSGTKWYKDDDLK